MKRRSFLALLASVWTVPLVGKASSKTEETGAWKFDAYQTPDPLPRPSYDCYLSDFGSTVIIKRPTVGDRFTIGGDARQFVVAHRAS